MKFLLDENLSPVLRDLLVESGHDVVHVRDLQMAGSTDEEVIAQAATLGRVLISADTDFGALLARTHTTEPSFILIRRASNRRAEEQSRLLTDNLELVADDLAVGAIVVLGEDVIRIRRLPI